MVRIFNGKKLILKISCMVLFIIGTLMVVYAATEDNEAPALTTVNINTKSANVHEKVNVTSDVSDSVSGVNNLVLVFYEKYGAYNDQLIAEVQNIKSDSYFVVPDNAKSGTWCLDYLFTGDNANNSKSYYAVTERRTIDIINKDQVVNSNDSCFVIQNGFNQYDYPINFEGLTINNTSVNKGDFIRFTGKAIGNVELITQFDVYMNLTKENGEVVRLMTSLYSNDNKNEFVSDYYPISNGNYKVEEVFIKDSYDRNQTILLNDIQFTASGFENDFIPPTLNSVKLGKKKYSIPSYVDIEISATDDVSGLNEYSNVEFTRKNSDGSFDSNSVLVSNIRYNSAKNIYYGDIDINQYSKAGEYVLTKVSLSDKIGNSIVYSLNTEGIMRGENDRELTIQSKFTLINSVKYDVITGTNANDCLAKIKDAKNDAIIGLDARTNPIISKEIFEIIKGTNKTIYIESDGIEWIFKGTDIVNPKDINVNVLTYLSQNINEGNLSDMIFKGIVIEFADNGDLPGVALVRIKANYTFRNYLDNNNLFIYYLNNDNKLLDTVKENANLTDDYYYEFYINHNSTYVISNGSVEKKYVSDNNEILSLNNSLTEKENLTKEKSKGFHIKYVYICLAGLIVVLGSVLILLIIKKYKKNKKEK